MTYQYQMQFRNWLTGCNIEMPKDATEANDCWEQISGMLSQESIFEDGELSQAEAKQKYNYIIRDAKRLHRKYKMPSSIREYTEFWYDDERYFT